MGSIQKKNTVEMKNENMFIYRYYLLQIKIIKENWDNIFKYKKGLLIYFYVLKKVFDYFSKKILSEIQ